VTLPRRGDDIKVSPAGGATSRYGGSGVRRIQLRLQPSFLLYAKELNDAMNQARGVDVQREKKKGARVVGNRFRFNVSPVFQFLLNQTRKWENPKIQRGHNIIKRRMGA